VRWIRQLLPVLDLLAAVLPDLDLGLTQRVAKIGHDGEPPIPQVGTECPFPFERIEVLLCLGG
jgi:hypothetical protein